MDRLSTGGRSYAHRPDRLCGGVPSAKLPEGHERVSNKAPSRVIGVGVTLNPMNTSFSACRLICRVGRRRCRQGRRRQGRGGGRGSRRLARTHRRHAGPSLAGPGLCPLRECTTPCDAGGETADPSAVSRQPRGSMRLPRFGCARSAAPGHFSDLPVRSHRRAAPVGAVAPGPAPIRCRRPVGLAPSRGYRTSPEFRDESRPTRGNEFI